MKEIPDFDTELSQATDYIMESPLATKTFSNPPFPQYTNVLRILLRSIDRLADNCHMPEFTNHALPHICSIVRRASEWAVEDQWIEKINGGEAGYLLLALIIHDIGMLSQDAADLPDANKNDNMKGFCDISNWVRRTHVLRIEKLVRRILEEEIKKDPALESHLCVVIGMASSHQKWAWDSGFVSYMREIELLGLEKSHIEAFNAVIAVCDLLDEDSNRCDTIALIKYRHGTMDNLAHWIRHALTAEVVGVRNHTVRVTFRKLLPTNARHEKIYRALRNHYRLVKLYNPKLEILGAGILHIVFQPADGIPEYTDEITKELEQIWINLPEFKNHIVEQLLSTFMQEALNSDGGRTDMRRRLDGIGLETIDLSEESRFLTPRAIYYPEEKILSGTGDFKERMVYLRELVEDAYLNGQIGKVRHLCFIAWKKWEDTASLNDLYWIYIFLSVLEKYGDESFLLALKYENSFVADWQRRTCNKLCMEGDYQYLLDVWFMFLEPRISDEWMEKYEAHLKKCTYQNIQDDLATLLLLEHIVGAFWYYAQEGEYWKRVADYLIEQLSSSSKHLADKLCIYTTQLKMQSKILFHISPEFGNSQEISLQPFAKAWAAFWAEDWEAIEADIPYLCKIANENKDFAKPVQGYLNMVQWNIQVARYRILKADNEERTAVGGGAAYEERIIDEVSAANEDGTIEKDEIEIGRYRYSRMQLEQPLAAFWQQRSLMIESLLGTCQDYRNSSSNERCQLLRLICLQTLDSIHYWDLSGYIDAIHSETRLHYLLGTYTDEDGGYKGLPQELTHCLICYIRGISENKLKKDERQTVAEYLMEYSEDADNELSVITGFITEKAVRIQWKCALCVVEVLARYFSVEQRKQLLQWLVKYHQYYKEQNHFFDLGQYKFLYNWTKDMEPEDWGTITEIIDEVFKDQHTFMVNVKLADHVMQDASWECTLKYLELMQGYEDNAKKSTDLYHAILLLSEREDADKEYLHKFVNKLIHQLEEKIEADVEFKENIPLAETEDMEECAEQFNKMLDRYRRLDTLIDVKSLYELEPVDLDVMNRVLDELEEKIKERGKLSGYDSRIMGFAEEAFCNQNWSGGTENGVIQVIDRIFGLMQVYRQGMSAMFFHDFCRLLHLIESSGTQEERTYINKFVLEEMVGKTFLPAHEKAEDNPLSNFAFKLGSDNQYEMDVAYLLVMGMREIPEEQQAIAIQYIIQILNTDEPVIYNYGMVMFSYYFLTGNGNTRLQAWSGMMFMQGRLTVRNKAVKEIREKIKNAVRAMEESEQWFGEKGFCGYVEADEEYKRWLSVILPEILQNIDL